MKTLKRLKTNFYILIVMIHLQVSYHTAKTMVQFWEEMKNGNRS